MTQVGSEKRKILEPFRFDSTNECLWRGSQAVNLRPKTFAVLNYLLRRPAQLVTKEELLDSVWPGTFVGEAVLKVAIRQIREALGDDPKYPRFIETAHRRGYRFIGQIAEGGQMIAKGEQILADPFSARPRREHPIRRFVGRGDALSRLQSRLQKILRGERQLLFVTGEAGIGKTALVDAFVSSIASDLSMRICRGQCLEQYGT